MRLTEKQSRTILAARGVYVSEICDRCGKTFGWNGRYILKDQPGEWCSRECRDGDAEASRYYLTRNWRKGGRPTKYTTEEQKQAALHHQKLAWQRDHRHEEKNPPVSDCSNGTTEGEKQPPGGVAHTR